jgi:hypothetical protein
MGVKVEEEKDPGVKEDGTQNFKEESQFAKHMEEKVRLPQFAKHMEEKALRFMCLCVCDHPGHIHPCMHMEENVRLNMCVWPP